MKFTELQLHPKVQASVDACGFSECTPIQEAAVPHILAGHDVAGLAQTGTGKTAAFALPLIDRILRSKELVTGPRPIFEGWKPTHFILVLVPTRELADQVCENVEKFGSSSGVKATAIYGGMAYEGQKQAIKDGVDFIVATPGRLIDLYKEHQVDLSQVRAVVFDEADRMFDMGFKDDMKFILRRVPKDRQYLVFSATLNFDVLNTAYEFGANPIEVNVSKDQAKADNVTDELFHVGHNEKAKYLLSILKKHQPKQAIIFSNFKHSVPLIAKFLTKNGVPALGISSLISQNQRQRIMDLFKAENDTNILVATDVAARGLDIKGVDLVVNYELPDDAENYVHRIGRTGRAGATGKAFSLVSDRDVEALQRIESYLGHKVVIGWLEDADIVKEFQDITYEEKREFRKDGPPRHGGGGKDFRRDRGGERHGGKGGFREKNRQHGSRDQQGGGKEWRPNRDQQGPRDQQSAQGGQHQQRREHGQGGRPHQGGGKHHGQRHGGHRHGGGHGQHKHGSRPQNQKFQHKSHTYRPKNGAVNKAQAPASNAVVDKVTNFFKGFFKKKKSTDEKNKGS